MCGVVTWQQMTGRRYAVQWCPTKPFTETEYRRETANRDVGLGRLVFKGCTQLLPLVGSSWARIMCGKKHVWPSNPHRWTQRGISEGAFIFAGFKCSWIARAR